MAPGAEVVAPEEVVVALAPAAAPAAAALGAEQAVVLAGVTPLVAQPAAELIVAQVEQEPEQEPSKACLGLATLECWTPVYEPHSASPQAAYPDPVLQESPPRLHLVVPILQPALLLQDLA